MIRESGGNLGIGTGPHPNVKLLIGGPTAVNANSPATSAIVNQNGPGRILELRRNVNNLLVVVENDGRVGIGTSNPSNDLEIRRAGTPTLGLRSDDQSGTAGLNLSAMANQEVLILASGAPDPPLVLGATDRLLYILRNAIGIGTATPTHLLTVSDGNPPDAVCDGNTWINSCSRTVKTDIRTLEAKDLQAVIDLLDKTDVVWFRYKSDESPRMRLGLIAEDVPEVLADDSRQGISTADAIGFLTAVVKAQQAKHEELTEEIRTLEERLTGITREIEALRSIAAIK